MARRRSGSSYRSAISGRYVAQKHGAASPRTTVKEAHGGGHRSAVTGRFVSERYAKTHPKTTVKES